MGPLRELLAIDHRQTLEFSFCAFRDLSERSVDRQELLYNASLLAHYAQVSTQPDVDVPAPVNLSGLRPFRVRHDPAARQSDDGNGGRTVPAPGGIFEDQCVDATTSAGMRSWARVFQTGGLRRSLQARLLDAIARRFELWRQRHAQLSRELRDQPLLLTPRLPPAPLWWGGRNIVLSNRRTLDAFRSHVLPDTSESDPRSHIIWRRNPECQTAPRPPDHPAPCGRRTENRGIIIPDTAKEKPQQGKVIATGTGKVKDDGTRQPPDVKAGDLPLRQSIRAGDQARW